MAYLSFMPKERAMEPTYRKISIRIWTPLLERFNQRIDSACLRRDAWLAKVLEHELDALDDEITEANSEAARQFISTRLDTLPRKLVTLTLPEPLVRKLDDICERKRIVRDSFFNRLFFLLAANHGLVTYLFFDAYDDWFQALLERTDFSSSAAGDLLDPIPEFRSPFATIREGLAVHCEILAKESGDGRKADECLRDRQIYTVHLTDQLLPKVDLFGLNVYLPDLVVPGTTEQQDFQSMIDDMLMDDRRSKEQKQ
jgi:hypothetical protein